jgi:CelD/BcsL family acetyltransferase involved in cellulose biosynthesis
VGELRSPTNYHTPSFGLLAEDGDALRSLAAAVVGAAPRRLTLSFLTEEDPAIAAFETASRLARRQVMTRVLERSPYISLDGTWPDLLASCRHQFVRGIRRRRRRLHERGRLETDVHDGRNDLDRLLEEGFAVEAAGWKGNRGTAMLSTPATRGFYTEIARWLAARGALRLQFLRFDGRAYAFDFAVEQGDRHWLLKTGYDEGFSSDSPGVLLRASMIESAFERRIKRYDFLGKDDPWKREWTSKVEVQIQLQSFGRSPAARVDGAMQRYVRPIARRFLKRS